MLSTNAFKSASIHEEYSGNVITMTFDENCDMEDINETLVLSVNGIAVCDSLTTAMKLIQRGSL